MKKGPLTSRGCLICGRDNPAGLHLGYFAGDGESEADWTVEERFCGIPGVLHGGMVLALLDDAMWYAAYGEGAFTMTAEVTVRYRAPVGAGRAVRVAGRVVERGRRLWKLAADLRAADDGEVLASAAGKFLEVPAADLGLQPPGD